MRETIRHPADRFIAGVKAAWSISATFIRLALELRRQKANQREPV
jgi:hypothetical protein